MAKQWTALERWLDAGLIDAATAERIRAFEAERDQGGGLRWPAWLALGFGALMLGAGVLLFVSANWDELSPAVRFALVVTLVAGFHVAGALTSERMPSLGIALHAVGTVALGAGIFLAGQIFHLDEHWPGGLMLWALGAAAGWWLLRDPAQMTLVAVLAPAWLTGEWAVATIAANQGGTSARVAASGLFLLALTYLTAGRTATLDERRAVLVGLGVATLPLTALGLVAATSFRPVAMTSLAEPPPWLYPLGWSVALGVPLGLAFLIRRMDAWPMVLAAVWVLVLGEVGVQAPQVAPFLWWAAGASALMTWGVQESRVERINLGAAAFAITVVAFYFSEVMDRLGRSASLVGLGLLFLAGGWAVERMRRRLIQAAREGHA